MNMAISESKSVDELGVDAFTSEIIRSYFLSVVREMVMVTSRAAYSTCFSEAVDFSCALFDGKGRLFAQAAGVPTHFGSLFDAIDTILREAGDLQEGDIILHGDPYSGASHQADVVVAMPMIWNDELLGLSVNRGHWADVGGMAAGGWCAARHVVQEGLIIPVCKLYRAGELQREVKEFVLKNVRMPRQCWGDLQAQVASARAAADRMRELIDRYGLDQVRASIEHSLDYARRRFRERMDTLPNGTYHAEDVIDDDGFGGGPYRIRVTIHKSADRIVCDFDGTDKQASGPANATLALTKSATYTALKALVDPEIPFNSGIRELIEVRAPIGTIVNPVYPAPVFFATGDPTARVCETVLRCWTEAIPERVIAGSYSSGHNSTGWGLNADGSEFMWYVFGPGGCGARKDRDGLTMEWHTMSSVANESIEIWEARYPVRFIRRGLRQDSGGPGMSRGGLGDVRVIECLVDTLLSACADRFASPPWGIHGGLSGMTNELAMERDGVEKKFTDFSGVHSPSKFTNVELVAGDRFIIKSGGGGGYGPPDRRDPELVALDVREEYVSRQALSIYQVALLSGDEVDHEKTEDLRKRSRIRIA